jgi:hypothetical protein
VSEQSFSSQSPFLRRSVGGTNSNESIGLSPPFLYNEIERLQGFPSCYTRLAKSHALIIAQEGSLRYAIHLATSQHPSRRLAKSISQNPGIASDALMEKEEPKLLSKIISF